jgi:hypothetical protein
MEQVYWCSTCPNLPLKCLSSCAGAYSGSSITNFAAGIKAWHLLHGRRWLVQPDELKTTLGGATILAPSTTKHLKRQPFTPEFITTIRNHLDLNKPLDAVVFACMTTTFYCIARLGEFMVRTVKTFDSKKHISRAGMVESTDRNGLPVTSFALPSTKSSQVAGEVAYWAAQDGPTDPKTAMANHIQIHAAKPEDHLFAWKHEKGLRPLSKSEFTKRVSLAASTAGLPDLKGHGLRIGGTLEYLLHGVPFDVVKTMGRWSRKHLPCTFETMPKSLHHTSNLHPLLNPSHVTPCHQCVRPPLEVSTTLSSQGIFTVCIIVLLTFGNTAHIDS